MRQFSNIFRQSINFYFRQRKLTFSWKSEIWYSLCLDCVFYMWWERCDIRSTLYRCNEL